MSEHVYNYDYIKNILTERDKEQKANWDSEYTKFMTGFHSCLPKRWPQPELGNITVLLYGSEDEERARSSDGRLTDIYIPEQYKEKLKFTSSVGLILELGPDSFIGPFFREDGRIPGNLGDWVIFSRNASKQVKMDGFTFFYVKDEHIEGRVPNPSWAMRGV